MITNICYLAVVGITVANDNGSRRYYAQLNGGHLAEITPEEYDELENYLTIKNRIEMETVTSMDPNAPIDPDLADELKRSFGHE